MRSFQILIIGIKLHLAIVNLLKQYTYQTSTSYFSHVSQWDGWFSDKWFRTV